MIQHILIDKKSEVPRYRQIEQAIENGVANGNIKKNTQLPSINKICSTFELSRDTVVKAYNALRERGIIEATHGKGYFITGQISIPKKKVFILFNELNAYKEVLHKALLNNLGTSVEVDTFFHNHRIDIFEYLIEKAIGKYTHYVIMPTFNDHHQRILASIQKIQPKKLYLIDRHLTESVGGSIYQNFKEDAYNSLKKLKPASIQRYQQMYVIYEESYLHPYDAVEGMELFCNETGITLKVIDSNFSIEKGILYVTLKDTDLVKLVKLGNKAGYKPGMDYGVLSYNESPMKEVIHEGITVISTDFEAMGEKMADMILEDYQEQVPNPVKIIERKSI